MTKNLTIMGLVLLCAVLLARDPYPMAPCPSTDIIMDLPFGPVIVYRGMYDNDYIVQEYKDYAEVRKEYYPDTQEQVDALRESTEDYYSEAYHIEEDDN